MGFIIEIDNYFAKAILTQEELNIIGDFKCFISTDDPVFEDSSWSVKAQRALYRFNRDFTDAT